MIVKTEGLVLKGMKYGDTSRIVSILSPDFGKLSVLAKGARDRRNKFGSSLDSMNHIQVILYKKEGRDLHLLSQSDTILRFDLVIGDLRRLECAMILLELVHAVSYPEEESAELFTSAVNALGTMNQSWADPLPALLYFETRLLGILGFQPELHKCVACKSHIHPNGTNLGVFRLTAGGVLCGVCRSGETERVTVHAKTLRTLQVLQGTIAGEDIAMLHIPEDVSREARRVLFYYLRSHVAGMKALKSESVFSAIC